MEVRPQRLILSNGGGEDREAQHLVQNFRRKIRRVILKQSEMG